MHSDKWTGADFSGSFEKAAYRISDARHTGDAELAERCETWGIDLGMLRSNASEFVALHGTEWVERLTRTTDATEAADMLAEAFAEGALVFGEMLSHRPKALKEVATESEREGVSTTN